jgi:hypothetical protein
LDCTRGSQSVSKWVEGTEWLDLISEHHIKPIWDLVELLEMERRKEKGQKDNHLGLCSLLEDHVALVIPVINLMAPLKNTSIVLQNFSI